MAQSKPCFDSLPDDMVIEIFSRLRPNKLLSIESVSRTWKRCVNKTLNRVELVAFEMHFDYFPNGCYHLRRPDSTKTLLIYDRENVRVKGDAHYYRLSPISTPKINSMVRLLKRCPQVKCLSLGAFPDIKFKDVKSLKKVLKALPQLECLRYGGFKIKKLINRNWLALCQEFGPRLKHLNVDGFPKSKEIINSLISASVNLEFVFLQWICVLHLADKSCYYLEALQNRDSIELSLNFIDHVKVDAEAAAVISRATNLTIRLPNLQSVGQHFSTFTRLKRLEIRTLFDFNEVIAIQFPALEHFNCDGVILSLFKQLDNYNLAGLKTLKIHQLDDNALTGLADKLTSLEKLVLRNNCTLPTDSLRLLSRLVDLKINYWFNNDKHIPKVVRLFKVVAEMTQLKRCRIGVTPEHYNPSLKHSNEFYLELRQAYENLRQSLPFVEFPIDSPFYSWLRNTSDKESDNSNQNEEENETSDNSDEEGEEGNYTSMTDDLTSDDSHDSTTEHSDSDDSESPSGSSDESEDTE